MAERQQALASVILQDPDVREPVVVHRHRRHQHHHEQRPHPDQLKPLEERSVSATDIIRRLQPKLAQRGRHHALHAAGAGPDGRRPRGRTQYQYSLEDADANELAVWAPRLMDKLQTLPELRDVASDQQNGGLQDDAGDRPRHRLAARHHAADDRRHALRRLRPAAGLDHLHAAQPVPRGAGSRAAISSAIPRT